jgi:hypothetical protein
MIAPKDDRQRTGGQNLTDGKLRAAAVDPRIAWIADDVATIFNSHRTAVEQRSADIEVPPVEPPQGPLAILADVGRGIGLVVGNFVDAVGFPIWDSKDGDIRIELVQIETDRKIVKALEARSWSSRKRLVPAFICHIQIVKDGSFTIAPPLSAD